MVYISILHLELEMKKGFQFTNQVVVAALNLTHVQFLRIKKRVRMRERKQVHVKFLFIYVIFIAW